MVIVFISTLAAALFPPLDGSSPSLLGNQSNMHLSSALALLVGLVLVVSVTSETEPTIELTDPQGCEYNGVHYEVCIQLI